MSKYDVTILTETRYVNPTEVDQYVQNILDEDRLLAEALEALSLKTTRTNWDDPNFDWSQTKSVVFRSTWDYFHRFEEFNNWLLSIKDKTQMINPYELIQWNLDKHYLKDLEEKGIRIPPTEFIEIGDTRSLATITESTGWRKFILKPAIAGAARHTYKLDPSNIEKHEAIFKELIENEAMLLQEFQEQVITKGEISLNVFGGKYTHAVLKKAKPGDFRVQDDFGGTLHEYEPNEEEINFAIKAVKACDPLPSYARVDIIWNNQDELCISELEMIEPELWFRRNPSAAKVLAEHILKNLD
ncbi:MAG: hypothetical protein NXI20_25295 [bacterium]|nr:hypothetical protein [bacterium]